MTSNLGELLGKFDRLHKALAVRERVKAYIPDLQTLLDLQDEMTTLGRADNNLCANSDIEQILRDSWGPL
ncbi:hypothetical protein [Paenalcaligenes faecalis]|uniref:hypothetical protein n=1 Tax=Paenalcaligenes faecalis TaxID=2980099 RepID=UPI0022B9CAB0|nr:hypothetical protein [Paenalcaligenes faecalis]